MTSYTTNQRFDCHIFYPKAGFPTIPTIFNIMPPSNCSPNSNLFQCSKVMSVNWNGWIILLRHGTVGNYINFRFLFILRSLPRILQKSWFTFYFVHLFRPMINCVVRLYPPVQTTLFPPKVPSSLCCHLQRGTMDRHWLVEMAVASVFRS